MGCGVEGEDVEDSGVEGLSVAGIGKESETDCRLSQYVEIALIEVGVEFLHRIEEAKNLLLIKIDIDHD